MSLRVLITVYLMVKKTELGELIDKEDKYTMSAKNCHL